MSITDIFSAILLFGISVGLAILTGRYMAKVYKGDKNMLDFMAPLERFLFRLGGVKPGREMNWKQYLTAFFAVNLIWFVWGFLMLILQDKLPLNPAGNPAMSWHLALNSTISFITSTNLQHYSGESGATYFTQIAVFMFLQFVSAAGSLSVGVAVVRGLVKKSTASLGNFWNDFVLSITRVLLPLSAVFALVFLLNGMPMTFGAPQKFISLQGDTVTQALGPVAAFIPIKELGSNGGGFFGANDAHPFENPNFFTFGVHTIIVFLLPMAFVVMIGNYLNKKKFSRMIFSVMTLGWLLLTIPIIVQETKGNPLIHKTGIAQNGNMEGKEVRYGAFYSAFYCGENANIPAGTIVGMHDSFMPLSGLCMLVAMQIDAFFGGVGTGWINMFIFLILALFIGTLMIGRTPELFGKKISIREMQAAVAATVAQPLIYFGLAAVACVVYAVFGNENLAWLSNTGPHGFTTMLYEYVSSNAGNGSGFEALGDNTTFWNLSTSIAMLAGRFIPIASVLFITGSLAAKLYTPPSAGTLPGDSLSFGVFLFAVIVVLQSLSMFPSMALGPINEYVSFK